MDAPTLAALADLYLLRCEVEGKSPGTVRAYRETVTRFLRHFPADVIDPADVQADHTYVYLGFFTGHSLETRHRYFREVRCFSNWLVELDYLECSPFRGMKNVRLPQRIVEPFSGEEVEALLSACGDEAISSRDRELVLVLFDIGARCSEIVQLNVEDLEVEVRRLRILHGKGNK
jgi:integrase/recombinase XerD